MTKNELIHAYTVWADRHQLFAAADDLDEAVQLISFDSGRSETTYFGTRAQAVAKVRKGKIHIFIFAVRTAWSIDNDFNDDTEIREEYRKIIAF